MSKRGRPRLMGRGVTDTGIACPLCAAEGHTTIGGYTPTLRRLAEGNDERIFCHGHGYISPEELA